MATAEMNSEPRVEVLAPKRRHRDYFGIEIGQGALEPVELSRSERIARSRSRLNSAAPYNTQAWPPISR